MKKDSRVRLFEVMRRVVPGFQNEGVNLNSLYGSEAYKKKAEEIKAEVDKLFNEEDFEDLDSLYRLMIRREASSKLPKEITEIVNRLFPTQDEHKINEAQPDETYFDTLAGAISAVKEKAAKKGYALSGDEIWTNFGTGGINYGQTKRANISLIKDGVPQKNRSVTIAIYRMDSGKYELTSYIN